MTRQDLVNKSIDKLNTVKEALEGRRKKWQAET